jgi:DNA mismatch endonuclease (patch repair protein)
VDGAFWHGYQWHKKKNTLKKNIGFWIPKIERNMQRDQTNNSLLEEKGYTVMRFWDHEIKNELNVCVNQILLYLEAAKSGSIPISE